MPASARDRLRDRGHSCMSYRAWWGRGVRKLSRERRHSVAQLTAGLVRKTHERYDGRGLNPQVANGHAAATALVWKDFDRPPFRSTVHVQHHFSGAGLQFCGLGKNDPVAGDLRKRNGLTADDQSEADFGGVSERFPFIVQVSNRHD
jgi:hypothetical protein